MAKIQVKLNLDGISQTLKSAEVSSDLERRAQRIAEAAGEGFEAVVKPGRFTARAFVQSATRQAAAREAKDKALTRALDAGR